MSVIAQRLEELKRTRAAWQDNLSTALTNKGRQEEKIKSLHTQLSPASDLRRLFVADQTQLSIATGGDGEPPLHYPLVADVQREHHKLSRDLQEMEKEKARPAVTLPNHPPRNCAGFKYIGHVASLGFVKDHAMARLISSCIGNKLMGALVFEQQAEMKTYQAKVSNPVLATAIDILIPFYTYGPRGSGQKCERTNLDKSRAALPLPHIQAEGNPRYMVNLIELSEEDEKLRDTLFFNLLRHSLVFTTKDAALKYRSWCRERLTMCGKIFTEDGWKIDQSGFVEVNTCLRGRGGAPPTRLDFVFGEIPVAKSKAFRHLKRDTAFLDKLIEPIQARESAMEELQQLESDPEGEIVKKEIRRLEAELSRLRAEEEEADLAESKKTGWSG